MIDCMKQKCPLLDFNIYKSATSVEVKRIQEGIFSEIFEYCNDNDLSLFVAYGTLIGAIRHNGYIPWDDDIDLWMLREDYDKLINNFVSSSGEVVIRSVKNEKGYPYPFAKASFKRSHSYEYIYRKKFDIGINIDIFPLDFVPSNKSTQAELFRKIKSLKKLHEFKNISYKKRNLAKQLVLSIGNFVLAPFSSYYFGKKINKTIEKFDVKEKEYVGCFLCPYGIKTVVPYKCFSKAEQRVFEKVNVPVPIGYDQILSSIYGDYMKLPPVEKQVTHHMFEAYIRKDETLFL